jgi:ketosteroid isomerase-like protein
MRALGLACAALLGCGGQAAPAAAPKQPAVDERKAETDAKGLVTEIYQTIGHADTDGLMTLLAAPLVVFGPRRADSLGSRTDALVVLKQLVDPKAKTKPALHSGALEVVASPGGHSAWAVDVVDIAGLPHVVTAVLSNSDDMWLVSAAAVGQTRSMKAIRAELKKDAVVPPGMTGIAKVDDQSKGAVDKFNRGLADQKLWGDDLSSRTDAVVIGPTAGDLTRGKADIKKLWKKRTKSNTRATAAGEVTAASTADGQLVWVSAPIVQFADDDDPLPMRAFTVFEKNGAEWKMIALQETLAFDEPGVGAPFKKVVAPVGAAKPEPAPAKPADPPPAKKPKKKKKPKKPADDDS